MAFIATKDYPQLQRKFCKMLANQLANHFPDAYQAAEDLFTHTVFDLHKRLNHPDWGKKPHHVMETRDNAEMLLWKSCERNAWQLCGKKLKAPKKARDPNSSVNELVQPVMVETSSVSIMSLNHGDVRMAQEAEVDRQELEMLEQRYNDVVECLDWVDHLYGSTTASVMKHTYYGDLKPEQIEAELDVTPWARVAMQTCAELAMRLWFQYSDVRYGTQMDATPTIDEVALWVLNTCGRSAMVAGVIVAQAKAEGRRAQHKQARETLGLKKDKVQRLIRMCDTVCVARYGRPMAELFQRRLVKLNP